MLSLWVVILNINFPFCELEPKAKVLKTKKQLHPPFCESWFSLPRQLQPLRTQESDSRHGQVTSLLSLRWYLFFFKQWKWFKHHWKFKWKKKTWEHRRSDLVKATLKEVAGRRSMFDI